MNTISSQNLMVNLSLQAWETQVKQTDTLFNTLTDAQLLNEISPGKNRGIYLLGHLVAVHDRMFSLLGMADRFYPQLDQAFILNPDKSGHDMPSIPDLKAAWLRVNTTLLENFQKLTPEEWLQKHTSVSEEDFVKQPHRNKLSVLISRTIHMAYHTGQIALLK